MERFFLGSYEFSWEILGMILGYVAFVLSSFLIEKDQIVGQFWRGRVTIGLLLAFLIAKASPLFYRFQEVLDHPISFWSMGGGNIALLGGLFSGIGFLSVSLLQIRKENLAASLGPSLRSLLAGGLVFMVCFFLGGFFSYEGVAILDGYPKE